MNACADISVVRDAPPWPEDGYSWGAADDQPLNVDQRKQLGIIPLVHIFLTAW